MAAMALFPGLPAGTPLSRLTRPIRPIRTVYTDLDGTMLGAGGAFTLDPAGVPTAEPAAALVHALRSGIEIIPVSGRAMPGIARDARLLGLSTSIGEMGAVTAYDGGRTVVTNLGDFPAGSEPPVSVLEQGGAIAMLIEKFPLELHTPWATGRAYTALLRGLVDAQEAGEALAASGWAWSELVDNGLLHASYLGLPERTAHVYHLMPRGVSKGRAIAADRARRGLDRDHCLAIGDSAADLAMASEVGVMVLTADAFASDERLRLAVAALDNVVVTERPGNLGWADTISEIARSASEQQ